MHKSGYFFPYSSWMEIMQDSSSLNIIAQPLNTLVTAIKHFITLFCFCNLSTGAFLKFATIWYKSIQINVE